MEILLFLYCLFFLEAWVEVIVIQLKNSSLYNYLKLNEKEHIRSFIFASYIIVCAIILCVKLHYYFLILPIFLSRRLFFDYTLILMRGRPVYLYEGTDKTNKFLSSLFGKKGRSKELFLEIILSVIFIILHYGISN